MDPQRSAYTDRDVLDNSSLEEIANRYVLAYTGNFQFILDCAERLRAGYRMGTAHIRTVLNVMRADPRVRELPTPEQSGAPTQITRRVSERIKWSDLRPKRVRPQCFSLPATWHHTYGMSTHRRAEVIHKLAPNKCSITYYPHALQHQFHDRFRVHISWVCGSALPSAQNRNSSQYTEEWPVRLLTVDEAAVLLETSARRMCPTCASYGE